jgi:hypothetical protein
MCSTRGCEGSATSDRPTRCGGDGSIGKKEAHMPGINGIAHVELSVRDLDKSVRWYCELLGAQDVFRATNDAYRVTACAILEPRSKLVLAFTQHREEEPSEFDRAAWGWTTHSCLDRRRPRIRALRDGSRLRRRRREPGERRPRVIRGSTPATSIPIRGRGSPKACRVARAPSNRRFRHPRLRKAHRSGPARATPRASPLTSLMPCRTAVAAGPTSLPGRRRAAVDRSRSRLTPPDAPPDGA